jgi:hypothetical protein
VSVKQAAEYNHVDAVFTGSLGFLHFVAYIDATTVKPFLSSTHAVAGF